MVGGDYIPCNLKALADDGRLVQIAFLQGLMIEVNLTTLMTRWLNVAPAKRSGQGPDHGRLGHPCLAAVGCGAAGACDGQ